MARSTPANQHPHQDAAGSIETLVQQLGAPDVAVRDYAVATLASTGEAAVPALIAALTGQHHTLRLEAARCLREIRAPAAAPALLAALTDVSPDVSWVAAEALAALGRAGLDPVLAALEQANWDASDLRQGAHTVIKMVSDPELARAVAPVLRAIEGPEPEVRVPLAAYHARAALGLG